MAGPGSVLFMGMIFKSHPSAAVASLMPGVRYDAHVGTSHSIHAKVFFAGLPVSGIFTPMPPSALLNWSTTAWAAATPTAPPVTALVPPVEAAVVAVAAAVVAPAAAVVAVAPAAVVPLAAVVDELLLSLPQAVATMTPHANTASSDLNLVMNPPLFFRMRRRAVAHCTVVGRSLLIRRPVC